MGLPSYVAIASDPVLDFHIGLEACRANCWFTTSYILVLHPVFYYIDRGAFVVSDLLPPGVSETDSWDTDGVRVYLVLRLRRRGDEPALEDMAACVTIEAREARVAAHVEPVYLDEDAGVAVIEFYRPRGFIARMVAEHADHIDVEHGRHAPEYIAVKHSGAWRPRVYDVTVYELDRRLEEALYSVTMRGPHWDHVDSPCLSSVTPVEVNGEPYILVTNVETFGPREYTALKMLERATPVERVWAYFEVPEMTLLKLRWRAWTSRRVKSVRVRAVSVLHAVADALD